MTTRMSAQVTPQEAWDRLVEGNKRFASGKPTHPHQDAALRTELASGQQPPAVVFGCGDSRVPCETVFDQGLGDVFAIRTAGQVLDEAVLGSLEFGVGPLQAPLLVVLGHSSCGAVGAARSAVETGAMPEGFVRIVAEKVIPTVLSCANRGITSYRDIVDEHVRVTVELLMSQSPLIREAVDSGRAAIVGATYQLEDGVVAPLMTVGDIRI
jgi:carbonic anhydrase